MAHTNLWTYERIAREANDESHRLLEAGRRPKADGSPGYVITFDPDQRSFKAALIAIVFAGIYLEALLYLEGTARLGSRYKDRSNYESKLRSLGVTDPQLLEKCRDFASTRNELVHEKAGSPQDLREIRRAQDEAAKAIKWFVGQLLRVNKQIADQEMLSNIHLNVEEIRSSLAERAGEAGEAPPSSPEETSITDPTAAALMDQARSALDQGLPLLALMASGAALEHSIRSLAERRLVGADRRKPVGRLVQELQPTLGPGIGGEIAALWRLRNQFAHFSEPSVHPEDAERFYDGFRWAVSLLSDLSEMHDQNAAV